MTRSNRFKVQAFFKEFSFVAGLLKQAGYEGYAEVNVQRIGPDFLQQTPSYRGATGSLVGISDSERIFLLDGQGNVLEEPRQAMDIVHNEAYQDNVVEQGETVGEALSRLEDPNSVVYAVCVHTGHEIRNHHSVGGFAVTVCKPPRGFSLREWVKEQQKRAEQMLAAQVAEIDTEATTV